MEPIAVVITVLSALAIGLFWRYLTLLEKRRDERHTEMVSIQKGQHEQLNRISELFQKEIRTIKEDSAREFRIRDEKQAEDFRIRDRQISDNRHQIKNLTANMMMLMAKEYPEFVKYMEKFIKND